MKFWRPTSSLKSEFNELGITQVAFEKNQSLLGVQVGATENLRYEKIFNQLVGEAVASEGGNCVFCLQIKTRVPKKGGGFSCPAKGTESCDGGYLAGFPGLETCKPITNCSADAADELIAKMDKYRDYMPDGFTTKFNEEFAASVGEGLKICSEIETNDEKDPKIKSFNSKQKPACDAFQRVQKKYDLELEYHKKRKSAFIAQDNEWAYERGRQYQEGEIADFKKSTSACQDRTCCDEFQIGPPRQQMKVKTVSTQSVLEEFKGAASLKAVKDYFHTAVSIEITNTEGKPTRYFLFQNPQSQDDSKRNVWCRHSERLGLECGEDIQSKNVEGELENRGGWGKTAAIDGKTLIVQGRQVASVNGSANATVNQQSRYRFIPVEQYPYGVKLAPHYDLEVLTNGGVDGAKPEFKMLDSEATEDALRVRTCLDSANTTRSLPRGGKR
mgnify:CR=1 FL=1